MTVGSSLTFVFAAPPHASSCQHDVPLGNSSARQQQARRAKFPSVVDSMIMKNDIGIDVPMDAFDFDLLAPLQDSSPMPHEAPSSTEPIPVLPKVHKAKGRSRVGSRKKPKNKPKRPLSAYNLFFQAEREKIIRSKKSSASPPKDANPNPKESRGKIGFAALARTIAARWKEIDASTLSVFEARAALEQRRYRREMAEWNRKQDQKKAASSKQLSVTHEGTTYTKLLGQSSNKDSFTTRSPVVQARPLWPALPETVASLGSMYDTSDDSLDSSPELRAVTPEESTQHDIIQPMMTSNLSELASKLDEECMDLLAAAFL